MDLRAVSAQCIVTGRIVLRRAGLFLCDLLVIALAGAFALLLRDNFETSAEQALAFLPYLLTSVTVAAVCLLALGMHRRLWRLSVMTDYVRIAVVALVTVTLAMAIMFLGDRLARVARAVPIIQLILMILGLVGVRVAARMLSAWGSHRRQLVHARSPISAAEQTVLVVGLNRLASLYIHAAEEMARGRIRVCGLLARSEAGGSAIGPYPVVGRPEQASAVIDQLGIQGVFVSHVFVMLPREKLSLDEHRALRAAQRVHGVAVTFVGEALGLEVTSASEVAPAEPQPAIAETALANAQFWQYARRPYWRAKRAFDVVASLFLIVVLAPIYVTLALLVALDVGLPVIFWQQRPGARGVPFRILKFRTMRHAFGHDGRRLSDTDRVSVVGRILRDTRLDELPQLFNVLVGDMSFIGPRPLLPVDQFPGLEARLAIPPGITGWAQVNGGREVSAADKAALDLWYLQNASPTVDVRILLATIAMLVRGESSNQAAIDAAWSAIRARGRDVAHRAAPSRQSSDGLGAPAKLLN